MRLLPPGGGSCAVMVCSLTALYEGGRRSTEQQCGKLNGFNFIKWEAIPWDKTLHEDKGDGYRTWGLPEHPDVPQAFILTRQTLGLVPLQKGLEKPIPVQGCARPNCHHGAHGGLWSQGCSTGCTEGCAMGCAMGCTKDVTQDAPSAHFPGKDSAKAEREKTSSLQPRIPNI